MYCSLGFFLFLLARAQTTLDNFSLSRNHYKVIANRNTHNEPIRWNPEYELLLLSEGQLRELPKLLANEVSYFMFIHLKTANEHIL